MATYSCFFFVHKYNKVKLDKLRIDLFVLADGKYYFVQNIDMYQGKNIVNIDIHNLAKQLPTTIKAVINSFLDSNIENDLYGARKLFLDNSYYFPYLFEILF